MPSGGHARSGPPPVEGSRTSDRRGISLTALPPAGYDGEVPDLLKYLPTATARHRSIWNQVWTTPQACAWAEQPWLWPTVASLVMAQVSSEAEGAPVSALDGVRKLRDDLGLSYVGMGRLGWKIAEPPKVDTEVPVEDAQITDMQAWLAGGA
jgi:hypothetical protein